MTIADLELQAQQGGPFGWCQAESVRTFSDSAVFS